MKRNRWLLVIGVLALSLAVGGMVDARCLFTQDTYCGFQCGQIGGHLQCYDAAANTYCCWEGPNTCGEAWTCSDCSGCSRGGGF